MRNTLKYISAWYLWNWGLNMSFILLVLTQILANEHRLLLKSE